MPAHHEDADQQPDSLRARALEQLNRPRAAIDLSRHEDVAQLIHELQVHQAELEIQNEELRAAQVALAESRDRFSSLYEFAPVGYVTLNLADEIQEANLTAAAMLHVDRKSLLNRRLQDFIVPESQDLWYLHRQTAKASPTLQVCEVQLRTGSDTVIAARLQSIPFGPANDRRIHMAIVDISDRKQAEEALRKLTTSLEQQVADQTREVRLLAKAISNLGEGVVITGDDVDWPNPVILFVNEAMCQVTGYKAEELIGQSMRLLQGAPFDQEHVRQRLSRGHPVACELRSFRKDGTPYDAEVFVTPLYNATGQRTNFISIHRDISDRKRAEQTLRASEERMRAILQTATSAIVTIDNRGRIKEVNPAAERMFGYCAAELLGKNVSLLMPPPFCVEHDQYIARFLSTGIPHIIGIGRELMALRKDGTVFPIELAVSQVDHLGLFTGILVDISVRRELQRNVLEIAAEEQRRIGQELHDGTGQELTGLTLIAGVIRDILGGLPSHAAAGQATWQLTAPVMARLNTMAETLCAKLAECHRNVQQLSHGIMPVQVDAEGLRSALADLADGINRTHSLTCHFDCPTPVAIGDNTIATHLYRIAQEAVSNALRHSGARQIQIALRQEGNHIILQICDDGSGIAMDHGTKTKAAQGLGLRTMLYRAGIIGGTLHIERGPQGGTWITCNVLRGGA
ncbi:MAG TPA: PAS domain S-box protein [Pirellulaceae bacterium]|nr:PAS domain S-box protein [Pirellulaceae bacterium]